MHKKADEASSDDSVERWTHQCRRAADFLPTSAGRDHRELVERVLRPAPLGVVEDRDDLKTYGFQGLTEALLRLTTRAARNSKPTLGTGFAAR